MSDTHYNLGVELAGWLIHTTMDLTCILRKNSIFNNEKKNTVCKLQKMHAWGVANHTGNLRPQMDHVHNTEGRLLMPYRNRSMFNSSNLARVMVE